MVSIVCRCGNVLETDGGEVTCSECGTKYRVFKLKEGVFFFRVVP